MTTTYTVAQALASSASNLLVVDTAANIANNLSNASLVSRVTLFSMSGNDAVTAVQATALADIGSQFSTNGYTLTLRDTVSQLIASNNAAGLTISGIVVAVQDTAAAVLAAASNAIIRDASSVALTADATLTLAQLLTLEGLPHLSANGLTFTLSDSAANLLALTAGEAKSWLTIFQVGINSTVTAAQAITLGGMSHFSVASAVTLTISDTITHLSADVASLYSVFILPGVAVTVSDTLTDLLTQGTTFDWYLFPNVHATLSNSGTVNASQAATLAGLPNFSVAAGQSLTIADTVSHLVALGAGQIAIASAISLSANDTATVAQLATLVTLSHFSPVYALTVDDTLAHLALLTGGETALTSAETIDDTVTNLLAAQPSALSGASAIVAELDGTTLDAAQATALAALSADATLTLHANGIATTLTISDTSAALSAASASITTLEADGPVTVVTAGVPDRTILTASAAAALVEGGTNPATETLAVADTGSALSAVASDIFGQGFEAITVTSGSFAGTMAELLDPTLHFAGSSSAQLSADAVADVAQALELAALPSFSRGSDVTLAVLDSITDILAAAADLPSVVTSILANDTEAVSAAGAATLATLTGFSLHGNFLILDDTAANLETATAGAIALASTVELSSDARISEAAALQFVEMGLKFSPNGFFVTIADTAANLLTLASDSEALTVVNSWAGEAVLSANATLDVADATTISQLAGFNVGTYQLTISDTASSLLGASGSVLALAYAVQISQASTVTAAHAATLEALHNFSAEGLLTIADTPVDLAATAASVAAPASTVSLAVETGGNASGYAIDAAQFAAMLALPNFSLAGFAGTVAVTDTAAALAALLPSLTGLSGSILSHITMTQSTAATVTVATAEALHALPDFSRGGYDLTISDSAAAIATLDSGTAGLATSIVTIGGSSSLTVTAFESLVSGDGFSGTADSLIVSDSATALLTLVGNSNLSYVATTILNADATLSAANAEHLSTLPGLQIGNYLTIADTAADLLHITGGGTTPDDWAIELQASSVVLTANATVNTTQATLLTQLGSRFSVGAYTLTVSDTAANLVARASAGGLALAGAITLSGNETALSAANATLLAALPNFSKGSNQITISDTAADLTFGGNAAGLALANHLQLSQASSLTVGAAETLIGMQDFQVNNAAPITITGTLPHLLILATANLPYNNSILAATSIALSQNTTATAAQIVALTELPQYASFSRAGHTLTVQDSGENLATLTPANVADASSVVLSGDAILTATQADALAALSISLAGYSLTVTGSASVLLNASNDAGLAIATAVALSGNTTVDAADATSLFALSTFSTGGHTLTISDTASALLALGVNPTQAATTIELSESGDVVSVAQLGQLAALGSKFSLNDHTLTVSGTLASLLTLDGHETALVSSELATDSGTVVITAAAATALANATITLANDPAIVVQDTAADLAFAGNAAGVALADTVQLSASASLTVAAAEALIGMASFQTNEAAPITIDDTLPDLLDLASANLAHNNSVLAATPIELSANAVATVAQMQALAALSQYDSFSLNFHTITVEDSGRHLASFVADGIAVPSAYVMTGDATLDADQAAVLAADDVSLGDNSLTVADTPTALLSLSDAVNALATGLTLSGDSTATAAQAAELETLAAGDRFTTGGYTLTVTGSAASLLGLSTPTQQLATTLALSESGDSVSVANLLTLAELGSKFSLNSNTLTVSDTAAHLATLNSLETALVSAAVLSQNASIDAATATELAALPDFSLGASVTLTVQDSYANLIALPESITSIATLELTGSSVLTAAEAAVLAALSNFSPGADIVVQDTIANLNAPANAGWPTVATGGYIVTDSVSNLLENAATPLLGDASSVTLLGDAQVDATDFATLANIAHFSRGTAALTVADTAAAIADNATAIELKASNALVDSAAPVSAQQAEELAGLNSGHMLSFSGGISLAVQDSLANLTALDNAGGIALASTITVLGTGAQLITATAHDWGATQPYYELNASGDITAPQATTLDALGAHYLPAGYTLTVTDNTANVVNNATAIEALGLHAQVSDTVAGVDAEAAALESLGSTLHSITLTDTNPVAAAAAAGLAPLVSKLTGPAIAVSDTASAVDTNLAALETLGSHLSSVTVVDTAADVAAVASDLSALGSTLYIDLSDATPVTVSAQVAAGLVPVDTDLGGTTIDVSDTGAQIASYAATLAELGSVLGTVTLSDGTATGAPTAAALAQIDSHLGNGVKLSVTDTAAAIVGAGTGLATMVADSRISSITAAGASVSDVLTDSTTLASLGATATISDSAAHVSAHLDALALLCGVDGVVTQIALNDGGTPDIALSLTQLTSDADVLALITGDFKYAISDTSAGIAADLAGSSHILALGSAVDTITISDSDTLTLTADTLLTTGVDDSVTSALTKLTGGALVAVTDVTVADFAEFATLTVAPSSFAVADSGGDIGTDLERGSGSSVLLAHRTSITGITPGSTITLDYATASTAHVNDGAGSIFAKMPGATLDLTGVPVTDITAVFTTNVHAASITVSDSAGDIASDLETGSPVLVQYLGNITGITVSPSGAISLDADHALAGSVDDGADSVFGKLTGGTLAVTGAEVDQLNALHALYHVPDSVAVSDTVSAVAADLEQGAASLLETYAADGMVTAIAATGDPLVLDDSYVSAVTDALALLAADSLQVTNVPIDNIASVADLGALASMTVSDGAGAIETDLEKDASSQLALHHSVITGVTVTGGPVILTDAQAQDAEATALALLPAASLDVTGVAVADIAGIAAIGTPLSGMTVSDTAGTITTDLQRGAASSELELHAGKITSVTATGGTVALSDSDAWAVTPALANFVADSLTISGASLLHAATYASLTGLISMTVSDTASDIYNDLTGDTSLLETGAVNDTVTGIDVTDTAVQLTDTQAELVLPALALLSGHGVTVSGVSVTDIGTIADLGSALTSMSVSGSNTAIHDDLVQGLSSELYEDRSKITSVTVTGGTVDILSNQIADTELAALALLPADSLVVSGASVADVANLAGLTGLSHMSVSDSATNVQGDIASGGDHVLESHYAKISSITVSGGPVTLEDSDAEAALDALALLAGTGTLVVNDVLVADVTAIASLAALSYMTVTDSAAAVQSDLELSGSVLEANAALIHGIGFAADEGTSVSLTGVEAGRVMDALAELPSGSLTVTGATETQVSALTGLAALDTMTVSDSAAAVKGDLTSGDSVLETYAAAGTITGITVNDAAIALTNTQAEQVLDALTVLGGTGGLTVSGVSVTDIPIIGVLPALTSMTVSASAGAIETDLEKDASSDLAIYHSVITSVTVTGGPVILTDAQAQGAEATALALLPAASLDVTAVAVADIAGIAAIGAPLSGMTVSDTAGTITTDLQRGAASSELELHAGKITSVTATGGTVALSDSDAWAVTAALANFVADSLTISGASLLHAATYASLTGLISMTVSDTASDIYNDLTGDTSLLETGAVSDTVTGIDVTDTAVQLTDTQAELVLPALALLSGYGVTVSGVSVTDIGTIADLGSALTSMTVSGSNTAIHDDLVQGASSELYENRGKITSVTVTGGTVDILSNQIADTELAALALLPADSLVVSGASVADVANLAGLTGLSHMSVSDSATNVQGDIASGGDHVLAAHYTKISSITVSDGPVTLEDSDAEVALNALTLLAGTGTLVVNDVLVADVTAIAGLTALSYMTVTDSAAAVQGDLELSDSLLEANAALIHSIGFAADEGTSVSLTGVEAARVMDALAELPSGSLTVTGAAEAQVSALAALAALNTMAVSDSAATVKGDLTSGDSVLETYAAAGTITGITVNDAAIALTNTQAEQVLDALTVLGGTGGLTVSGVSVTDIPIIGALTALTGMTVSGGAGAIETDLEKDASSDLAIYHSVITSVTVTGGPVILTDTQAQDAEAAALALLPAASLDVTGVAVADIAGIAAIGTPLSGMTVSDTAGKITTDLQSGAASSELELHAGKITSVTATGGTVALSDSDAWAVTAALANFVADSLTISGASLLHAATYASLTGLISMTVSDTASDIYNDLTGDTSLLETGAVNDTVTGIDVTDTAVQLTDTQAELVLPALALLSGYGVTVSGVSVMDIGTIAGLGSALTSMTVSDTNTAVHDDLINGLSSELYENRAKITSVTVTGGTVDITTSEVADVELSALALLPADTLVVTGVLVAGVAGLAGLTGLYQMTVSDSAANVQADIASGGAHVLETNHALIGSIAVTDGPVTLEDSDAEAGLDALALIATSDSLVVNDVLVSDVAAIAGLTALSYMTVTDSAAAVQGDLELSTSHLETNAALIHSIGFAADEGTSVSLTGVEAARVMDALAELPSGSLTVTGAAEAQVAALAGLAALDTMTVAGSAASIQGDLALGADSAIETNIAVITGIAVTGTIALDWDEAHLVLTALGELTSGSVAVSDVPVLHIDDIGGLGSFASMTVSDGAGTIAGDLILDAGSQLAAYHSQITGVTVTGGPVMLTDAQALDAEATALALLPEGSLEVTGVAVADIAGVAAIGTPLLGMDVSDAAGTITTDLQSGAASSELELYAAKITSVTATGGPVALSDSDAWAVTAALANFVADSLTISDASVLHAATYATFTGLISMTVSDTASDIYNDLTGGTSVLEAGAVADTVTGIDVTDTAVQLTDTQAELVLPALALLSGYGVIVSGVSVMDIGTIASLGGALTSMTVSDTNTAIHDDLINGLSSELYENRAKITSVTVTGGTVDITATEVADVELAALALLPADTLVVTGVTVAGVDGLAGLTGLYQMTVSDTASHVHDDLVLDASSVLETNHALIGSITVTGGPVTLDYSDASTVMDALALLTGSDALVVTGVAVANVASIAALTALETMAVYDTATLVHTDLTDGASSILEENAAVISGITFSSGSSITLTGAQAALVMDALAELPDESLTVTGASVAQVDALAALGSLDTMTVSDQASAIGIDLALGADSHLLAAVSDYTSISVTDGPVDLDFSYVSAVSSVLAKLPSDSLVVEAVPVADVSGIAGLGALSSMAVLGTGGSVETDLNLGASSQLQIYAGQISSIALSTGSVTLEDSAAELVLSALPKLPSSSLTVDDVTVSDILTISDIGAALAGMTVTDTVDAITTDLESGTLSSELELYADKITSVTATGGTVALSDADAWAVTAALANFVADSLTISGASLLHAATYAALTGLISMTVTDTASDIKGDLISDSSLLEAGAVADTITGIDVTDAAVQLTDTQAEQVLPALALLSGYGVTVSGVSVADVGTIGALGSALAGMSVSGSNTAVHNDLVLGASSELYENRAKISSISLASGQVTLTDAQADSVLAVLGKLPSDSLVVTGVPLSDVSAIAAVSSLDHMTVVDSDSNIVGDVNGAGIIASNLASISSVTVTDASIDAADAIAIYGAFGSKFDESALTISDTAAALVSAQVNHPGALSAAEYVTLSANASGISAASATTLVTALRDSLGGKTLGVADTASDLLNAAYAAGIDFATTVQLSSTLTTDAATATQLAGLHGFTAGPAITIQDSPTSLLNAAYTAGLAIATTVEPDGPYTIVATTLAALALISGFSAGGEAITVTGNVSAITGLSPTALGFTTLAHVTDSSATVSDGLAALQSAVSAHGDTMSITLTDGTPGTPTIFINATTYADDRGAIDSIATAGAVEVTDGAAAMAAVASELATDTVVSEVDVDDSAANILANLTALETIGSKLVNVTITDSSLNASEVASLLTIPNLQTGAVTISDTGSQIAAAIQANGQAGLNFLNAQTVELSGNSVIAASDAVLLEELTSLNKEGYALVVWDTASHLTDSVDGYLAAEKNSLITAVYLKTTGGTATITAATAGILLSIPTFSKDNPPISLGGTGTANVLTVSDTAAHIDAQFSALRGGTSSLSSIVVSGSATVTESVYADLLTLGAIMAGGQSLTVRDTAASIIADAPGQLGGSHSITPSAWQISGSATVSEAGAAYLGGLTGFSAGAYTLTLSASDATTSESDANAIGVLGSAFHLGGYQLTVSGSVSYVSGLTTNARLIVTSDITDSFAQIATLTLGDGLLDGTITVNDSEAITTTQAADFLALLGGSGIPVSKVSFGGNVESITDTLSNIQTLTSSAAWTSNNVHSDFSLVVADTVATLINPSNTSALAAMAATTLNSNQTVSAAAAESLFAVESTINFSLGSYTITIQDTATDLLNPSNSDGEAIATVWQLSGPDSVNTAGAETLLPDSQFHLNHLLTVSDTSDNLLDGVLSGVITTADAADAGYGGSIHVTLSDSETLDANTAEALVSLPGFQNTGELSIADESSYLLNPNNLTAETDATSVTLAGDETMSAATMGKLAALPNFVLGENTVTLASNDYANAATLKAIADFGSGYHSGGFTLTMTQDDVSLTPAEYAALQSDDVVLNGHALSAIPTVGSVSSSGGDVFLIAAGVSGATLNVYAASGSEVQSSTLGSSSISVTQSDAFGTVGGAVVVTETMPGHSAATGESAPLIAIDQTIITADAGAASFSSTGGANAVQVGTNEYMQLYTAGSQPASPVNPVLVYDPSAHTLSFDVGNTSIVLVTLGAQTHPASLSASEIAVLHFG